MARLLIKVVIVAVTLGISGPGGAVERMQWLANCWSAVGAEPGSGEVWTTVAGGGMFGIARTIQGDRTPSFEFMQVRETGDSLVFIAQPGGGAPVRFPAVEIGETHAVFENPDHDFPRRVIYRLNAPGELSARIEGAADDAARAVDFRFQRTPCDARPGYDPHFAAEVGADDYGMRRYVIAFLKAGPNRDRPRDEAAALMRAHLDNITRLANEGSLVVAGPFIGGGPLRGIYIFDVATVEEARALTETDPAIQAGSLEMELHPWYGSAALRLLLDLYPRTTKQSP